MKDGDCVHFLQWALPRLRMRWPGFRKVRRQVCKRLARRIAELALSDIDAYRHYLSNHAQEWKTLDRLCRVVVTRFYRDRRVFATLVECVLTSLASSAQRVGEDTLRCWSIGSASGEEPYTLAILWHHLLTPSFPHLRLTILGTEVDPCLLQRSATACYPQGTVKDLPEALRDASFTLNRGHYCLRAKYRAMVDFCRQDIRTTLPDGPFDLILCRNLVFTYYDEKLQRQLLKQLLVRLRPGGWLVLGAREQLPEKPADLEPLSEQPGLYRRS